MSSTRFNPPVPTLEATTGFGDTTVPDGDGIIVPGENDYSSSRNKTTLRSYISSLTKGIVPTENIVEYNGPLPPPHANPFPLERSGEDGKFSDQVGLDDIIFRDALPGSPLNEADLSSIVTTGPLGEANDTLELSGHELLAGVEGDTSGAGNTITRTTGAKAYAKTLGEALASKNINSGQTTVDAESITADRSFISEESTDGRASPGRRTRIGSTELGSSYNVADVKFTSPSDLANIGRRLMIAAMGEQPDTTPDKWFRGPTGAKRVDSNDIRIPVVAQGTSLTDLNKTMLSLGQDTFTENDDIGNSGDRYSGESWPTVFGPDASYTGFTTGQAAFTSFVTGGTFIASVLTAAAVGLLIPALAPGSVPAEVNSGLSNSRRLRPGAFRYEPQNGFLAAITNGLDALSDLTGIDAQNPIYSPTNPLVGYGDCVVAGLAYFLGVSIGIDPAIIVRAAFITLNGNTAILLGAIAARLLVIYADAVSRQYYMGIIRELNRDTVALGGELGNVSFEGDLLSDVGSALSASSSIFNSKLFKFVNTLARIGDLAYTQAAAIDYRKTNIELDPNVDYSSFDPNDLSGGQKVLMRGFGSRRVYGNKLKDRRGVTYSLADLPSYHLIPNGAAQAYQGLLGNSNVATRIKSVSAENIDGRLRFTPEQVSAIESTLEAEYMPFYFQDLRTNEIVAFHAFLEDLSDSYTANYNNAGGYGRIEEVKTYKDTKRSISFSFHIIATNPQDFDYMWWQINKLTTAVYPQWSKGRELITDDKFKFTQPFSQIPGATPIMRVRIGDLIRSNYSRFNLKRLFGRQDNDKIKSQTSDTNTETVSATVTSNTGKYLIKSGRSYETGINGIKTGPVTLPTVDILGDPTEWFIATKVEPALGGDPYYLIVANAPQEIIGTSVWVDESSGNVRPQTQSSTFLGTKTTSKVTDSQFYDPENNSVVKSFETTRGYGLAGVVTQLQFTWMDGLWGAGEDGPGNRAPRSCKVQVSFEPIHDIAPGLDHEGFNRAPIYPVGELVNSIIEGNEPNPYGVNTNSRFVENVEVAVNKAVYEDLNKQTFLQKLF